MSEYSKGEKTIIVTSVVSAVVGVLGLFFVIYQLHQSNKLKRFENYAMFNKIYDDWYVNMPDELKKCSDTKGVKWNALENDDKAWVRRYFNLYAQEYYFYKEGMIPKEMWSELIHGEKGCKGAALINLREYPLLLEGYQWWKSKGAFGHPSDFTSKLDKKIEECKKELEKPSYYCQ